MRSRRHNMQTAAPAQTPPECLGLRLQSLRCLRDTTQSSLAEALKIGQTALSHLERRGDILLSTLAAYIQALGGHLHIAATFPDGDPVKLRDVGRSSGGAGSSGAQSRSVREIVRNSPLAPQHVTITHSLGCRTMRDGSSYGAAATMACMPTTNPMLRTVLSPAAIQPISAPTPARWTIRRDPTVLGPRHAPRAMQ